MPHPSLILVGPPPKNIQQVVHFCSNMCRDIFKLDGHSNEAWTEADLEDPTGAETCHDCGKRLPSTPAGKPTSIRQEVLTWNQLIEAASKIPSNLRNMPVTLIAEVGQDTVITNINKVLNNDLSGGIKLPDQPDMARLLYAKVR